MTQIAIQQQIDAIKKATEKALESKESARKFLLDAGLIKEKDPASHPISAKKK